jgi:hypothetical protein
MQTAGLVGRQRFDETSADVLAYKRQRLTAHVRRAAILIRAHQQIDVDVATPIQKLPGTFERALEQSGGAHAGARETWPP